MDIDRQTIRQYLINFSNYLPPIGSIWGLLLYALTTYFISLCCMKCLGAYTQQAFDVEKAIKEQILYQRKKKQQRDKMMAKVKQQLQRREDNDDKTQTSSNRQKNQ